jgi:hypothetical protein
MDTVYYESIKRESNKRLTCECRCDTRLNDKVEGSTRVTHTRWSEEFESTFYSPLIVVYYESLKREVKTKPIKELFVMNR